MMSDALTMGAMMDALAKVESIGPHRIIVGCPIVGVGEALEFQRRRVLFIGQNVLDALMREADFHGPQWPHNDIRFLGIVIEPYGMRADHREIVRDLLNEMTNHKTPDRMVIMDDPIVPDYTYDDRRRTMARWSHEMTHVTSGFTMMGISAADAAESIAALAKPIHELATRLAPVRHRSRSRRKW